MSAETTTQPYAICTRCDGVEFANRDEALAHSSANMTPIDGGPSSSGHPWRVVNPTPEEVQQNLIRSTVGRAIEDATNRAFEDLDREIQSGRVTEEDVTAELRNYPDFDDAWDEYRREAGE